MDIVWSWFRTPILLLYLSASSSFSFTFCFLFFWQYHCSSRSISFKKKDKKNRPLVIIVVIFCFCIWNSGLWPAEAVKYLLTLWVWLKANYCRQKKKTVRVFFISSLQTSVLYTRVHSSSGRRRASTWQWVRRQYLTGWCHNVLIELGKGGSRWRRESAGFCISHT